MGSDEVGRRGTRLHIVDGTLIGAPERFVAYEIILGIIDLQRELREEEIGATIVGREDTTTRL